MSAEKLITDHIDIWTSAVQAKSASSRGSGKKRELYGIKKLRELILDLAFSGKLVRDESQKVDLNFLLGEMYRERVEFHERKGVRLQKFKVLPDTKLSFDLPSTWEVVTFNEVITYITDFQANGSFSTIKQNVQYFDRPDYAMLLRLTDLRHGLTDNSSYKYTDKKGYDFLSKSTVHGGELVVANVGAGVGTTLEVPQIEMPTTLAPNMFMVVLSKQVDKSYFLYFCQSSKYKQYIEMVNTGTGQPKINKTEYKNCQLPLPSLQEQNQVVAKVDELMTLCDQLEQQTEASLDAHQVLVETLLATLTNSQDATELMANWGRISEHFDTLFTTEQSIDQLKQTILQLAVMGKLVPFGSNTEKGGLKKFLSFGPRNGYSPKEVKSDTGVKVLKLGATSYGSLDLNESKSVDVDIERDSHLWLNKGDILIQRGNSANYVGCNCLVEEDVSGVIYPDLMMKIRPSDITSSEFLSMWLSSPMAREFMWSRMTGTSGTMPKISKKVVESIPIVMPSRQTQDSIVAKAQDLLSICEHLKQRIRDIQQTQLQLTDTIVEQAL